MVEIHCFFKRLNERLSNIRRGILDPLNKEALQVFTASGRQRGEELLKNITCQIIKSGQLLDSSVYKGLYADIILLRLLELRNIPLSRQAETTDHWQKSHGSKVKLYSSWHIILEFWLSYREIFEATTWIAFGSVPPFPNIDYDQEWGGLEVVLCAGFCIAISLAVLWGVCWMFHGQSSRNDTSQNGELGEEASVQGAGFGEFAGELGNLTDTSLDYGGDFNNFFPVPGSYNRPAPAALIDFFPVPLTSWPDFEAAGSLGFDFGQNMIIQAVPTKSTVPALNQSHLEEHVSSPALLPANLRTVSLSPRTDPTTRTYYSQQEQSTRLSNILSEPEVLGHMEQRYSDSEKQPFISEGHTPTNPPQNEANEFYCDHPDCASSPPTFRRKCDWSKHMDKHTRPYHCNDPGCRSLPGFTYKGGLNRHQQQVHGQHGGPPILWCPHSGCKRSSGKSFPRKENLAEHLKRIHRSAGTAGGDASTADGNQEATECRAATSHLELSPPPDTLQHSRKRRRAREDDVADGTAEVAQALEGDLMGEVKRLKAEEKRLKSIITEKDSAIAERDAQLKMLQEMLRKAWKG